MDDKVCRKMLINQKYFASLLRILISEFFDLPEARKADLTLKGIAEEIDKILYEKAE